MSVHALYRFIIDKNLVSMDFCSDCSVWFVLLAAAKQPVNLHSAYLSHVLTAHLE